MQCGASVTARNAALRVPALAEWPLASTANDYYAWCESHDERVRTRIMETWDNTMQSNMAYWFRSLLNVRRAIIAHTHSSTSPLVWLGQWTVAGQTKFGALTDDSSRVVIKSQALVINEGRSGLWPLTCDTMGSGLLRQLTLLWPATVTPHFATLVTAFAGPAWSSEYMALVPSAPARAYVLVEDGGQELIAVATEMKRDLGFRAAVAFQVFSATAAALDLLGFVHHDLHWRNIMLRDVTGTPYADKPWLYVRPQETGYYVIEASQHRNQLVEIIDFDLSRFYHTIDDSKLRAFFNDWWRTSIDASNVDLPVLMNTDRFLNTYRSYNKSLADRRELLVHWPHRVPLIVEYIRHVDEAPMGSVVMGVHPAPGQMGLVTYVTTDVRLGRVTLFDAPSDTRADSPNQK
jgi:hypothetical protein